MIANVPTTPAAKVDADHGPTAAAGLTIREYQEMQELEYFANQDYLDYINDY
jgi:hypothetical protein